MPDLPMGRGPAPRGPKPLLPEDVKYILIEETKQPLATHEFGVKDIDRLHRLAGYTSCAYHFVVRTDGILQQGRKLTERGVPWFEGDDRTIGICVVGPGYTAEQKRAVAALVDTLTFKFPDAEVLDRR